MIDYDDDGYPEPSFADIHYQCWHYGCSGSPRPHLVWKWDGVKYRLANYKLGDQILERQNRIFERYNIPEIDTLNLQRLLNWELKVEYYDPAIEESYPIELLRVMLDLIYTGHPNWADTLFNKAWPDSVAYKQVFYDDVMQMVHSSPYWPQLQQSDW